MLKTVAFFFCIGTESLLITHTFYVRTIALEVFFIYILTLSLSLFSCELPFHFYFLSLSLSIALFLFALLFYCQHTIALRLEPLEWLLTFNYTRILHCWREK